MLGFDNTLAVKKLARRVVLNCPTGAEQFAFQEGQVVKSSGLGTYKAGVPVEIKERYRQHGYCYYRDSSGIVHRQKDLAA